MWLTPTEACCVVAIALATMQLPTPDRSATRRAAMPTVPAAIASTPKSAAAADVPLAVAARMR